MGWLVEKRNASARETDSPKVGGAKRIFIGHLTKEHRIHGNIDRALYTVIDTSSHRSVYYRTPIQCPRAPTFTDIGTKNFDFRPFKIFRSLLQ